MAGAAIEPDGEEALCAAVAGAAARGGRLIVEGAGSKRGLGRPVCGRRLRCARLSGITLYQPEELVLSARAGTPISEICAALRARGQMLGFEPPDLGPVFGGAARRDTLGGVIACNLSGPRRMAAGAARDHLLGFEAVSGRGEFFKSGGRVVKNVTGYDVSKLMAGSYGTLGVLTRITVKVAPAPEAVETIVIPAAGAAEGLALLGESARLAYGASGVGLIPAAVAAQANWLPEGGRGGCVVIRFEGLAAAIAEQAGAVAAHYQAQGAARMKEPEAVCALWKAVRDVAPFAAGAGGAVLWRLSLPRGSGPQTAAELAGRISGARYYLDWGGALGWLQTPLGDGDDPAHESVVRRQTAAAGGTALLMRAPEAVRRAVEVFPALEAGGQALRRRIKQAFDPRACLNRGLMFADL